MNINIVNVNSSVGTTKKGEPYSLLEVTYKDSNGRVSQKKILPFGNSKDVYDVLATAKQGDWFSVETAKNGMYTDWTGIARQDSPPKETPVNYKQRSDETQIQIIRQSSIKAAADLLQGTGDVEATLAAAKRFEDYVLGKKADFSDMEDDIPFSRG